MPQVSFRPGDPFARSTFRLALAVAAIYAATCRTETVRADQPVHGPAAAGADDTHLWSLRPLRSPTIPRVRESNWPLTEMDRFILARLEQEGLTPAAETDPRTLLRRTYFVLTGLPPAPADIDAFLTDTAPDAYERLVDRLLASPHFGERWGRHWLDVARYAQSTGGGRSMLYDSAWRYRDYVVRSFNQDKPFDRFIREQIAGDLLPHPTTAEAREQLIATAFLVLGPTNYELQDKEQLRMDVVDEQIDTIGRVFLGMTLGCARCHDHKFDPVPTRDYYALAGIFRSTKTLIDGNVSTWIQKPLPDDELVALQARLTTTASHLKERESELAALRSRLGVSANTLTLDDEDSKVVFTGQWQQSSGVKPFIGQGYRYSNSEDASARYEIRLDQAGHYEVQVAYTPHANRTSAAQFVVQHAEGVATMEIDQREQPTSDSFASLGTFNFTERAVVTIGNAASGGALIADAVRLAAVDTPKVPELVALESSVEELRAQVESEKRAIEQATVTTLAVEEEEEPGDYHVCIRGNVHELGEVVRRGFLSADRRAADSVPTIATGASGRLELAEWLASDENRLTARVAVNRVWHHLFGFGIVRTVDNFGRMGERPSHPELLDYLAIRLIESDWRIKPLIREIMISRTWRQSSDVHSDAPAMSVDPENRLLSHQNRRRLDAEALYDSLLSIAGTLDHSIGGPNVRAGTTSEYGYEFQTGRRAMYLPVFRNELHGLMAVFDFPDPNLSVGRRSVTTLPTQALYVMNSPFVLEQASRAADRLLSEQLADDEQRVALLYECALGRPPTVDEQRLAQQYLATTEAIEPQARKALWTQLCQVIIACIDFRYLR